MKAKLIVGGMTTLLCSILVSACSSASHEAVGTTNAAISELNCASRALGGTGEGVATSSYTVDCSGLNNTSTDGLYGYTNCTHGFIWEITQVNGDGGCDGRKLDITVTPASNPVDQTNCNATTVTYYVYGLDNTNGIQYAYSTNVNAVACQWAGTPANFCSCVSNGQELLDVDLDNWPDGFGGTLAVDGIRIVSQAYNSNLGAYVKVHDSVTEYEASPCCIHR